MASQKLVLPSLPAASTHRGPLSLDQLSRKRLQALLHAITGELKARGTRTPHVFLPFRLRIDDTKLEMFLRTVFPHGQYAGDAVLGAVKDFDEFTLVCGLKYLWCRLPNNEVIGWKVYLEFRRREHEAGYPKDAFLTIMPKCLLSSAHASIVYDFLDLLISIASNSQYNHLSGRKVAKMASLWAFNVAPHSDLAFYDATAIRENTFLDGLDAWKLHCNGLFHLCLSFLRAMLPDTESDTLNLPKTLQSLLVTSSYPPPDNAPSTKSVIVIPCVQVRTTVPCSDPYELISKVRHTLRFDRKDDFLSIENYTILKSIFQKGSTNEIVDTLTEESRRVLTRLCAPPIDSEFNLYPGWVKPDKIDTDIPMYSEVSISNVTLQDYYIWTWLLSLGSDQTVSTKALFGRSIVVEAGLHGFQKWLIISEVTISPEDYINKFKDIDPPTNEPPYPPVKTDAPQPRKTVPIQAPTKAELPQAPTKTELPQAPSKIENPQAPTKVLKSTKSIPPYPKTSQAATQKNDLPPPPPIEKDGLLPDVNFEADKFSFESLSEAAQASNLQYSDNQYSLDGETRLAADVKDKLKILQPKKKTQRQRPPPPLLVPEPQKSAKLSPKKVTPVSKPLYEERPLYMPEFETFQNYVSNFEEQSNPSSQYLEPYDTYVTPQEKTLQKVDDPYENYVVPGEKSHAVHDLAKLETLPPPAQSFTKSPPRTYKEKQKSPLPRGESHSPYQHQDYSSENPQNEGKFTSTQAHAQQNTVNHTYLSKQEFENHSYDNINQRPLKIETQDHNLKQRPLETARKNGNSVNGPYDMETAYSYGQKSSTYEQNYPQEQTYENSQGHHYQYQDIAQDSPSSQYPQDDDGVSPQKNYEHEPYQHIAPSPEVGTNSSEGEVKKKKKKKKKRKEFDPLQHLPDGPPPMLPPMHLLPDGPPPPLPFPADHAEVPDPNHYQNYGAPYLQDQQHHSQQQPYENYTQPLPAPKKRSHMKDPKLAVNGYQEQPYNQHAGNGPSPGHSRAQENTYISPQRMEPYSPGTHAYQMQSAHSPVASPNIPKSLTTQPVPLPGPQQGYAELRPPPRQHQPQQYLSPPHMMAPRRASPQYLQYQQPPEQQPYPIPNQGYPRQASMSLNQHHMVPHNAGPMHTTMNSVHPSHQKMNQPHGMPEYPPMGSPGQMPVSRSMPPGQPMYGYPPPHIQQQMYFPPPQGYGPQPVKPSPTTSELTMMSIPTHGKFNKNKKPNKAGMRAALTQGEFGI